MVSLPRIKLPSPGRVYIPSPHMPRISAKLRFRFVNKGHKIADYMRVWERIFLFRAGASLMTYAKRSFKRRKNRDLASPRGKPPYLHSPKSGFLRQALKFAVDLTKKSVLVGIRYSVAELWGLKHEKGGRRQRVKTANIERLTGGLMGKMGFYPKRPFMKPAFHRWIQFGLPAILKDTGRKAYRI